MTILSSFIFNSFNSHLCGSCEDAKQVVCYKPLTTAKLDKLSKKFYSNRILREALTLGMCCRHFFSARKLHVTSKAQDNKNVMFQKYS